jgi:abhydrolase domain-containing protein 13
MPISRPFMFLCTEGWNSEESIEYIPNTTHILLLSGLQDELVPPSHMERLWEIITRNGEDHRRWAEFEHGTHSESYIGI